MYTRCPKCGHTPLPADQSLPAACPACAVILAKVGQRILRTPACARSHDDPGSAFDPIALLAAVPRRVDAWRWWCRVALWAAFAVWGLVLISMDHRTGELGASFLHGPLLVFHEAGHVIFALLGHWMMVFGGTLAQLLLPLILAGALLLKNRDPFGASIGMWLVGVSLLDVAPYLYDALRPQLMLLSGGVGEAGGHDWIYLLSSMGLLAKSQVIGGLVHKLGAVVVLGSLAWGGWLLKRQYSRMAPGVPYEEPDV